MKAFCLGFLLIGLAYCNGVDTNTIPFLVVGEHTYTNAQIIRVNPLYVTLDSDSGFDWAYLSNMPAFFKEKYGYTPEKAAKFIPDQKEAARVQLAKQRAAQLLAQQQAAELAQKQRAAVWAASAKAALNSNDDMYEEGVRAAMAVLRSQGAPLNEMHLLQPKFKAAANKRLMVRTNLLMAVEWYGNVAEKGLDGAKESLEKMLAAQSKLMEWQKEYNAEQEKRAQAAAQLEAQRQAQRQAQMQARQAQDTLDEISSKQQEIQREQLDQAYKLQQMKSDQDFKLQQMKSDQDFKLLQNRFKQKP